MKRDGACRPQRAAITWVRRQLHLLAIAWRCARLRALADRIEKLATSALETYAALCWLYYGGASTDAGTNGGRAGTVASHSRASTHGTQVTDLQSAGPPQQFRTLRALAPRDSRSSKIFGVVKTRQWLTG